jgi:AbrB family looped-hinge helix DNA binding protein
MLVKVQKGYRITIPKELREKYGFEPGVCVKFRLLGDGIIEVTVQDSQKGRD